MFVCVAASAGRNVTGRIMNVGNVLVSVYEATRARRTMQRKAG